MSDINSLQDTYLSFVVGNEFFAVNVGKVLEKQPINQVPNAPQHIRGVINFRGEIISILESRCKFGIEAREHNAKFVIMVLELTVKGERYVQGVVVDRVKDVLRIVPSQIKPVPKMDNDFNTEALLGVAQLNNQFIMLLNVDKIFNERDAILQQNIEEIKHKLQ